MSNNRHLAISKDLTTTLAQRRELARANPPAEGLNGHLAFEMLATGQNEIWRSHILPFL